MLRAVSVISLDGLVLEQVVRREFYKTIRVRKYSSAAPANQTVLSSDAAVPDSAAAPRPAAPPPPPPPPSPPPPPPPPPRRAWPLAAAALAVTASLGGVYFYSRLSDGEGKRAGEPGPGPAPPAEEEEEEEEEWAPEPYPAAGADFPRHVDFLLVGGGTASFAAMRAIRAARPSASVLLVGDEPLPPYMRPPLSKELWREPAPRPADLASLTFRQWNGKRRPLLYEPLAFYTPVERLGERAAEGGGAAGAARGWRVHRLRVERHEAELRAPGRDPVTVSYGRCLVAPGVRPRRLEAARAARAAGRALAVRGAGDAARLARLVDAPDAQRVLLVGGGFLASELAAALAARLTPHGKRVTHAFREEAPLARVLPPYLAAEAARRLRAAGVELLPRAELRAAEPAPGGRELRARLAGAGELRASVLVECAGAELERGLARRSGLELAADGALAVNAELQARADVWAAGDAVSWHDVALGRRTLQHHDHAVASGRRAGENMAAAAAGGAQLPYAHQPMFWSDLGPDLGYEAIGIIDSRLSTVGVFSAADVRHEPASEARSAAAGAGSPLRADDSPPRADDSPPRADDSPPGADDSPAAGARRYERGVVFYQREGRVVGVLLWNLFNRMHVARQVLAQGEFEDLFEVAKLFSLHEDD